MVKQGHLKEEEASLFFQQLISGIKYLRDLRISHRDLKLENLLLDERNRLKIIDFGSVKVAGLDEITSLQKQQHILGTMQYTAPEYFLGESGSSVSDLFSLGVTLLEMLFYEHMDIIYERGYKRIVESKLIEKINKITSKELKHKIKIILSLEPLKRYQILKEYSLVNSKAENFIKSEKEEFKR